MPVTPRLVLDWDGTVTEEDTLVLAVLEFGDADVYERTERALEAGELTFRQVMEAEMATIRAPLADVRDRLLERVRVRPGFRELAERQRPLLLSSGFVELIEPLLAREGVEADVAANRLDARPDGWRVVWRQEAACAICGDWCKRDGLPATGPVAFVGDGWSDRCAALAADRVFARGSLARYLDGEGVAYEPFDDFHDVARALERRAA